MQQLMTIRIPRPIRVLCCSVSAYVGIEIVDKRDVVMLERVGSIVWFDPEPTRVSLSAFILSITLQGSIRTPPGQGHWHASFR